MNSIAFFDTKPYDKKWFDEYKDKFDIEIKYLENRLDKNTAMLAYGCEAVVAFVSDNIDKDAVSVLKKVGVKAIAMRCAGFNNVDLKACGDDIKVYRVPAYSPASVAEHAMAMLLTLNRKTHRAYNRTREFNFSLKGLTGFDLKGKTVGIVGMGKIGQCLADICLGFGMKVIAYDLYPNWDKGIEYVSLEELWRRSDVISLHCPLTSETYHMMDKDAFSNMKKGVYIINTSRGALVDSEALLEAIKSEIVGGACLDVYEEETELFYEDFSDQVLQDDMLNLLSSQPNVLITSHQAFLTEEALEAIAETTLQNLQCFFEGRSTENQIRQEQMA